MNWNTQEGEAGAGAIFFYFHEGWMQIGTEPDSNQEPGMLLGMMDEGS